MRAQSHPIAKSARRPYPRQMKAKQTRGKTREGRLDALDRILLRLDPAPRQPGARIELAWDLGFGAHPHTTLAWSDALCAAGWPARVLGLEAHPGRAAFATRFSRDNCRFGHLDASWPAPWNAAPRWVRAMNVLRQYRASQAELWHRRWGDALETGGHLIEGTCSSDGSVLVSHWLVKTPEQLSRRGLIFYTDFSQGFAPILFGDRLPKDLRAHARKPGALGDFFRRWTEAWTAMRAQKPQQAFLASTAQLQTQGESIRAWPDGNAAVMVWEPKGGVPKLANSP